jgi:hypothetical protein
MDNLKYREEFFQNENADITDLSQTEILTINAMTNMITVPLDHRLYILATMQSALRIDFEDYQNFLTTKWETYLKKGL